MTVKEILQKGTLLLKEKEFGNLEAQMLLAHVLGIERTKLLIQFDRIVDRGQERLYFGLLQARLDNVPVQYLIGECEFMSLPFFVDKNVLIPRSDTEILVEEALRCLPDSEVSVADICCGSGCIGVSIAYYQKNAKLFFADLSPGALQVAERNARRNGVWQRSTFATMDVLKDPLPEYYDAILANPPYIQEEDYLLLEPEVREHEPRLALVAKENGLQFYRILTEKCTFNLKPGGFLAFEVGIGQAEAVKKLMKKNYIEINIIPDLNGIDRVVIGRKSVK